MSDSATEIERLADDVLKRAQAECTDVPHHERLANIRGRLICMGRVQLKALLAKIEQGGRSDIFARIVSELYPQAHLQEAKAA
jgi:hypothetical protein